MNYNLIQLNIRLNTKNNVVSGFKTILSYLIFILFILVFVLIFQMNEDPSLELMVCNCNQFFEKFKTFIKDFE